MPTPPPRLLALDTASLYFRAFYGVKNAEPGPAGVTVNAVRGLLDMIATLTGRFEPTRIAACWDEDWRPAFRVAAIPSYKAHRVAEDAVSAPGDHGGGSASAESAPEELNVQVPIIRQTLQAIGIPVLGAAGYEADDVIGTLVARHRATGAGGSVVVVTGDRDLFQLVDDAAQVTVAYTARAGVRDAEVMTQASLHERYGVPDGRAYAEMAILRGDPSDGLPGVPGIGEKTAVQLLGTYGSLDALREAAAAGDAGLTASRRGKIVDAGPYLDAAPAVVEVVPDAPVEDRDLSLPTEVADPATLEQIGDTHGLQGPINRCLRALDLA